MRFLKKLQPELFKQFFPAVNQKLSKQDFHHLTTPSPSPSMTFCRDHSKRLARIPLRPFQSLPETSSSLSAGFKAKP